MTSGNLLFLFGALVLVSALFSAIEIALFSIPRARARRFAQEPGPAGDVFRRLLDSPHAVLVQILLASNLVNVAVTATATVLLDRMVQGLALPEWVLIASETVLLTAFLLVVTELTPKTLAFERNEAVAPALARVYGLLSPLLGPPARGLERLAGFITGVVKGKESDHLTADELETLVEVGAREGTLNAEESRLFRGAFRFGERTAGTIMTPRADVVMMPSTTSIASALEHAADLRHARIPLYEGRLARVVGVLYAKDLLRFRLEDPGTRTVATIMRQPLFVPPERDLETLLRAFQAERVHLAVVTDPAGEALGLVTLEDVLEEIVGEIEDEFEDDEPAYRPLGESGGVFLGSVAVSEVNRLIGTALPGTPGETLAGLCERVSSEPPAEGETLVLDGASLTVEAVTGRRVWSVRVTRNAPAAGGRP